jgi:hypothetical protein
MIRSRFERALAAGWVLVSLHALAGCGGSDVEDDDGTATSTSSATTTTTTTGSAASTGSATSSATGSGSGATSGGDGGNDPSGSGGQGSGGSPTGTGGAGGEASSTTTGVGEPPVVTINHPGDGETRPADEAVPFIGVATDAEDGNLADDLVWTSDLDGQFGVGAEFSELLSVGTHVITAEVTDADGNIGFDEVTLTME